MALSLFPKEEVFHVLKAQGELDPKRKIGSLVAALRENPRSPLALCSMAIEEFRARNYSWSMQFFLRSIESDPTFSLAYSGLGLLGLQLVSESKRERFSLEGLQAARTKIESYLKHAGSLGNATFKSVVAIVFRSQFGQDEDEVPNVGELASSLVSQLPLDIQRMFLSETQEIKDRVLDELRQQYSAVEQQFKAKIDSGAEQLARFCEELLADLPRQLSAYEQAKYPSMHVPLSPANSVETRSAGRSRCCFRASASSCTPPARTSTSLPSTTRASVAPASSSAT